MKQRVMFETLLKDMSHNTKYEILTEGSENNELQEIAAKFGIKLPCNDLAIFKGTYAYVNKTNLNGCSLPKAEVEKALSTLRGKAIDFDHLRKRVVGYHLDAILEGDDMICYGIFFKGNFPEDYDIIKECMAQGKLGISFEAWGEHVTREDGDYDLIDIEFAGGALLIESDPAFPGAGVLELAKNTKVLEFAKVMVEPTEYIHKKNLEVAKLKQNREDAKYNEYEFEMVMRALGEVPWHAGEEECWREISSIDFENSKVVVTYQPSGTEVSVDLTPQSVVTKKGKMPEAVEVEAIASTEVTESFIDDFQKFDGNFDELEQFVQKEMDYKNISFPEIAHISIGERTKLSDNDFGVIKKIKNITSGKRRKVRMFPLHDATHVKIALARLEQDNVKDTFNKLGISYDNTLQRILKKAKELKMNELLTKYEQATVDEQANLYAEVVKELASLKTQIQELTVAQETAKTEYATLIEGKDAEIASLTEKVAEISKTAETAQAEIARRDAEITEAKLAQRKETLGDTATGMEDADILDDIKYELALLKKENAELKAAASKTAPVEGQEEVILDKGSKDKNADDELVALNKRVLKRAYPDSE